MTSTPHRIWRYLGSLWGALSVVAILFPGAASFLGTGTAPAKSQLGTYYTFLPSVLAAFALLFLTSMRTELANLQRARRWAVRSFAVSVALLFAFLLIRQTVVALDSMAPPTRDGGNITTVVKTQGVIRVSVKDTSGTTISQTESGDPWDIALLALLSGAFMLLTVAFGSLGINEYSRR